MSIKPVLSFRGVFVGAVAVGLFGVVAFAFGERSYSAILTGLFTAEAAEQTTDGSSPGVANASDEPNAMSDAKANERSATFGSDRIIFGQGNLPLTNPARVDKIQMIQPSGTPTVLTNFNDFEPQWSADGTKIVFVSLRSVPPINDYYSRQDYREIYTANSDGSSARIAFTSVFSGPMQPTFSPDGQKIAFLNNGDQLMTVNVDGTNETEVDISQCFSIGQTRPIKKSHNDQNLIPGIYGPNSPDFSPDGNWLIYSQWDSGLGVYVVFRVPTDGSGGCSLLYESNDDVNPISPQYSPDGTKIAVYRVENSANPATAIHKLRILDSATGAFIADYQPAGYYGEHVWSPDGTKVAYPIGQYDPMNGVDVTGIGVRVFELATSIYENVDTSGISEGVNGLHWGVPAPVPPVSLRIANPALQSGSSTTGTVYLQTPAPVGGAVIQLFALGQVGAMSVPVNITVPAGQTQASFPITSVTSTVENRSADVFAQYSGNFAYATVKLLRARGDLKANTFTAPASVAPGVNFNFSYTVQNIGPVSTFGTGTSGGYDYVYFSADDQFGPEDGTPIRTSSNNASLAAGATRTVTNATVNIAASRAPSAGQYYLILKTNAHPTQTVFESNYNNNTIVRPITIDLPDVVPENLVLPPLVEPGVSYPVSWTTRNIGTIASAATSSRLYYSPDATLGDANDIVIDTVTNSALAPNATQNHNTTINISTVPARPDGMAYFYVKVDHTNIVYEGLPAGIGENNNTLTANSPFEYRVADLQVTAAGTAPEVETETAFPVEWTTSNAGNKAAGTFSERIYFSNDNQVGSDLLLGTYPLSGGLTAGASVTRVQNVTIPTSTIAISGNYYIYIQTDAAANINEGENESNNTRFQAVYVRRLLRPDLIVTNVTGPPTVFFDQTVQVQWTVTNSGPGPTNSPQWTDHLYIGTNPANLSGATSLTTTQSVSALNPGESYTASAIVKIPRGYNGGYYFHVKTDSSGDLNEENTTNNLGSSSVQVNVPPLPDLMVETVQSPDEVFGGQEISINYTVRNIGTANAGGRRDRIYFSRDTVLSTSQDRLVFTSDSISGPAAGQATSYVSQNRVSGTVPAQYVLPRIPSNLEGLWYVFVVTDYSNDVYEFIGENNNTNYDSVEPGAPINVFVTPPDLVVPNQPTAPATTASGTSFPVDFVVKNQGAFNASPNLYHAVYLSTDQTFNALSDTLIGSFKDTNFFAPAAEHSITTTISLPNCLANGTYYLFAVADYNGAQFEFDPNFDAEANNASPARAIQLSTVSPDLQVTSFIVPPITIPGQSVSLSWTVANPGGPTTRNSIDRLYLYSTMPGAAVQTLGSFEHAGGLPAGGSYTESRSVNLPSYMQGEYYLTFTTDVSDTVPECGTSENNNSAQSSNFSVQNNLPDLVIDSVTAPSSAVVGESFNVQWTGRNANQAMPDMSPPWSEGVYLSADQTVSNDDYYIGGAVNNLILAGGQTYPKQTLVTIGNVPSGTYYVLVYADTGNHVYEGPANSLMETNNFRASSPITLTSPAVDLQVGNVSVSLPHHSGTYKDFSWTVTNVGTSQTLVSQWSDYVILSRDSVIDQSDTMLGYRTHTTALVGGASYTQTANFFIPSGLTGDYRVFVITDRSNSVVESNNTNNTSIPVTIDLMLPPPAELNITNITPPATISLGGNATFSWTVQNTGANVVNGKWRDTVYLSRDQFWDASDTLVGICDLDSQTTSVPAGGGTYSPTSNFQIPPVEEGTYYVIVRTDSQNRIRESDEGNNVRTSVGTTTVTITQLQINTPFNTTLGNGAQQFFKYVTDPDETLVFSLTTDKLARSNEAFTKFDTMVSRADYDFFSTRPGEGNQENVVSSTREGDYYSVVRTDLIPESFANNFDRSPAKANDDKSKLVTLDPQNITVNARILPFSIRKVSPEEAGNAGYATIVVEGAKFQPGATMKLVMAGSPDVVPSKQRTLTNEVVGMFDLKGKAAGIYDVVVTNPNTQTAVLQHGFTIISGGGAAEPRITINGPGSYRGTRARYTISMSNDGLNDLYLVPFFIVMPSRYGYQLDQSNVITDFSDVLPPDAIPSQVPVHYEQNGLRIIPLTTPVLGSRRTVSVNIDIILPFGFSNFEISAFAMPPLEDWYGLARTAQEEFLNRQIANISTPEKCEGKWNSCMAEALRSIFFTLIAELLPGGCVGEGYKAVLGISDYVIGIVVKGDEAGLWDAVGGTANILLGSLGGIAKECFIEEIPWYKAAAGSVAIFKLLLDFYMCYQQYIDCMAPPPVTKGVSFPMSFDPNEKIGPTGYGAEHFVPVGKPLEYRVNFENLSSATAPAQLIRITDSLPPPLDLRTVRLKEIGFKQNRIVIPNNQSFYQSRVQLGTDLGNLQADILAGVDLVNNRVFWNLQAIDPNTSETPLDPFAGLLPPNNPSHDGEGYVIFTAEAKSSFPNRTAIGNFATIIFDQNEPIVTNTTLNLLDSVVPTSQIATLSPTSSSPNVELNWTGTDDTDGSGFAGNSILVSENGGAYIPLVNSLSDITTTFKGRWGKSYRFYSIGRDNAGNEETAPTQPDATIKILGGDTESDLAPRPNGNDGVLSAADTDQVRRFVAGLDTNFTYNEFQRADMSPRDGGGNGTLSVADVMQSRRFVGGLDLSAEAGGPNEPSGLLPKTILGKKAASLPREIKAERVTLIGDQVLVAIRLEAQGDETGLGFAVNFNPAVLSNPVATLGPDASGAVLTINRAQTLAGKLGVMIDKAPASPFAAGSRKVLMVVFDVVPGPPPSTQITFGSDPVLSEVVNGTAASLATTFSVSPISLLAPTAAGVQVSGTVVQRNGQPIRNARVSIADSAGFRHSAITSAFGQFRFDDIAAGQTYTIDVWAKGYVFTSRLITANDEITGMELSPEP